MFWAFKSSIVVNILAFFALETFGLFLQKLGEFFSDLQATLLNHNLLNAFTF
jgi:hypothetical protein